MHIKKALAAFGAALVVSQGAAAITIINTDSTVGSASTPQAGALASQGVAANPSGASAPVGLPPLPGANASSASLNDSAGWEVDSAAEDQAPKETSGSRTAADSIQRIRQAAGAPSVDDSSAGVVSRGEVASVNVGGTASYPVKKGWLSDALESLTERAGYELKWDIGKDGKADFRIHRNFQLTATSAQAALTDLIEPYPIRICMYERDRIARAIPEGRDCR